MRQTMDAPALGEATLQAILLRSGIGPAAELAALGVPVAADLPGVGRNLADHPLVRCAVPVRPGPPRPNFQVVVTWRSSRAAGGDLLDMHAVPGHSDLAGAESPTGAVGFVLVGLVKPRSRGRLWLRSAAPADPPRVDPAYLRHPDDLARMVEGLRMARALLRAGPLAALAAGPELSPGERVADADEPALAAFVHADVSPYHHPVGTCAMGPDPGGQHQPADDHGRRAGRRLAVLRPVGPQMVRSPSRTRSSRAGSGPSATLAARWRCTSPSATMSPTSVRATPSGIRRCAEISATDSTSWQSSATARRSWRSRRPVNAAGSVKTSASSSRSGLVEAVRPPVMA
jgi:choline dehydrogenase-like flavoprotein